eukprot:NODE_3968_length_618_cov_125.666081_g2543_i2.p4 GENE.NODE_3968_length_618_cov_125.666081_g2543_i2~~NODE_3968_length_618_cov_125.666081_g2543_i2.p4  ORF type:complete len:71 (-),score=4.71 NODE_3968_length_618_cov_125.666081_g2543_i2:127-339(-)
MSCVLRRDAVPFRQALRATLLLWLGRFLPPPSLALSLSLSFSRSAAVPVFRSSLSFVPPPFVASSAAPAQ